MTAYDSTLNIVIDGNSLIVGQGAGEDVTRVLAKTQPFASYTALSPNATSLGTSPISGRINRWKTDKGVYLTNWGVNGQTWQAMTSNATDVDGSWVEGKTNLLALWEGTNSIISGRSAQQAFDDGKAYIAARRALHPGWLIIVGTCLPRQGSTQAQTDAINASIDAYNAMVLSSYQSMGADGVFDVRQAGSPFNLANYLMDTFEAAANAVGTLWAVESAGAHVHLNSDGYTTVARTMMLPSMLNLLARGAATAPLILGGRALTSNGRPLLFNRGT